MAMVTGMATIPKMKTRDVAWVMALKPSKESTSHSVQLMWVLYDRIELVLMKPRVVVSS